MNDQRVLKNIDRPALVADGHGCHDCPSWKRGGGNGSACGICHNQVSKCHGWLTSYAYICPAHPDHPRPQLVTP